MSSHRQIIAHAATSADCFIARPDGDVEWLNRRPDVDYGMLAFYKTVDTILMGRGTYDWAANYARQHGAKGIFDSSLPLYVFTHRPPKRKLAHEEFVTEPVKSFVKRLRAKPGKHIWMMGGGKLIASFLDAGLIDVFDICVIPTLIGKGIPLIAPRHRDIELKLKLAKPFPDGVVRLKYELSRAS